MRFLNLSFLLLFSTFSSASEDVDGDLPAPLPAAVQHVLDTWDHSRSWMADGRVVIMDTETTGIRPRYDRIVQLTLYEVVDGSFTGHTYNSYFNPHASSSSRAYKAHRLGRDFLSQQPEFSAEFQTMKAFIGESIILGHNIAFDVRMLDAEYRRLDGDEEWSVLSKCSLAMARRDHKRATLTDLTNSQLASLVSPAPKVTRMKRVPLAERRRQNRDYEAQRDERDFERLRTMPKRLLSGSSQEEARDQRAKKRAAPVPEGSEDAENDQENDPAFVNVEVQNPPKRRKKFNLESCLERAGTSPEEAVRDHGFELIPLAKDAGVPRYRRGQYHDAFTDVAGTLGLFDHLSSTDSSSASSSQGSADDDEDDFLQDFPPLNLGDVFDDI